MTNFDSSTSLKKYADQDFIYFVMSEKSSIVRCKQLPLYKDVSALECMHVLTLYYIRMYVCIFRHTTTVESNITPFSSLKTEKKFFITHTCSYMYI